MDNMVSLIDKLNRAAHAYYELDAPILSDQEYDRLYDQLVALEKETGVTLPVSPTRRVGGAPLAAFLPYRHPMRLYSLDKAQTEGALVDWFNRTEKRYVELGAGYPPLAYSVEYKLDGLTVSLSYANGTLQSAATRGNGEVGEAIRAQVETIRSVPLSIPFQDHVTVQGECIMRLSVLSKYNQTAAEPLKNARNAAAGALRNLDPRVTASRKLDAFFYTVEATEGINSQSQALAFLSQNGFPVELHQRIANTPEKVFEMIRAMEAQRALLDVLVDGVVIKIDDFATRDAFGHTDKFPRWAVAYKFEAEEAATTLASVTWELGRTGRITPLAHLDAVDIAGVTVAKATLNNVEDIQKKNLAIGCRVSVRRSGDVIPEILGRLGDATPHETPIVPPTVCPACGAPVTMAGAYLLCTGLSCRDRMIAAMAHYASRDCLDIEGFSEKTAALLYDQLGVRDVSDLYTLTQEMLVPLPGMGTLRAGNLLANLALSKTCPLDAFLYALGIPNVGRKTARLLAQHFGTLVALENADIETLQALPDVGPIVSESIFAFFQDPAERALCARLLASGVSPTAIEQQTAGILNGQTVVITGTLPTLSRKAAETMVETHGGKVSSSVSKNTTFVVAGEAAGSKLTKAQSFGIPILSEDDFLARLP